ncbi:MAG: H4MPT-linked C1 transfer pathway protein [Candidatus Bathyarchaeota archaeon]|nr:H4MPT-linked C1 transfer pathway protein [Candidatus Bathyarchaeota archaeon]
MGGANTKAALIHTKNNKVTAIKILKRYFPIWKKPDKLISVLLEIKQKLHTNQVDSMGLTMTAELSDAFQTKREGVNHILDSATQAFDHIPISVLNIKNKLISVQKAKANPLEVAAANWVATGWLVSQKIKNCVIIDVGSTSTSIIPIMDGKISALGYTDFEKLKVGELVYTGSLRTNIAAIVKSIPIKDDIVNVSSEFFSQSGDIHLILGSIVEEEYFSETPDYRGKKRMDAMNRLAKVVCGDLEVLEESEIYEMAKYIYSKQIEQISEGLKKVYSHVKLNKNKDVPIVVTGIGKNFLAKKAANKLGIKKIIDISQIIGNSTFVASPAVGVALMEASRLIGRNVIWKL